MEKIYRLGIDIGSTTAKMVVADIDGIVVMSAYKRHQTRVKQCLTDFIQVISKHLGNIRVSVCLTGSVGMGVAERCSLTFVQEVVAATGYVQRFYPETATMIDIGGEDAKMVFFIDGKPQDLRMNGNCAGGTGAFIDQMASLLHVSPSELGLLAERSSRIYPIASRCGVFCKTDIQNLIARNVPREDIAASIFHAVSVQTIVTLAHGHEIGTPVLMCGGPLTFIPSLRKAFSNYLNLSLDKFILPDKANLIPAHGAALSEDDAIMDLDELMQVVKTGFAKKEQTENTGLKPLFRDEKEYTSWRSKMAQHAVPKNPLQQGVVRAYMGVDSGSTTTKIVLLDESGQILFTHYADNMGNPINAVEEGLRDLERQCMANGTQLQIIASCSTGYGEDLVKAAFQMDSGVVETMAHYMAARHIDEDVSFVLDIGGQDMKAMFVDHGVLNRIEVNEACSSGCGSFISTFAASLGSTVDEFAGMACLAPSPCDLGTRCTVFMNSKVKQVLRDGAAIADIAAGLSYSVVKNCLYKVLRLKDATSLGGHIVVQGGTMRNDSVVRALELLTGQHVYRSEMPELMGAFGCALYAMKLPCGNSLSVHEMLSKANYSSHELHCGGCENRCSVTRYRFDNDNLYYSGNRCEKIFNNKGNGEVAGKNAYERKRELLFSRHEDLPHPLLTIGIPRCLNMYEEYPFWHTLFTKCNIQVCLSDISDFSHYERCAAKVMSDNICFPAKLVHSHIDDLLQKGADRIFMPFVVYERRDEQMQNSFNCPIVSGYSQVVNSVQNGKTPIDTPTVSFSYISTLRKQCETYLSSLGVGKATVNSAFIKACSAQNEYEKDITACNEALLSEAISANRLVIMLAGRPYHADSLIQHKVSEMVASQGAYVLTDDYVRGKDIPMQNVNYLSQWAYPNRILKAARWVARQDAKVQFMQLTSFGCGPDAFLTDEVRALLHRSGKNLTLLKIDDVNNIGSLKLRVRSLIESLRIGFHQPQKREEVYPILPVFTRKQAQKKIIVPFFTPFISPLLPSLMRLAGYDLDCLPMSDEESVDWGLKNSNNEICYPATLIVGDIIKAFRRGVYDPDNTCVAITQTGGQCRASNYLSLIRKALVDNGYVNTPVLSVSFGSGLDNVQPGFKVNWLKMLPVALAAILFSDSIAKYYYASVVRERQTGVSEQLREHYMELGKSAILSGNTNRLYELMAVAADDFSSVCRKERRPRIGIVGEIFLKFHPFAQKHVTEWLVAQGIEVVYPALIDFFLQSFVNMKSNRSNHLPGANLPNRLIDFLYRLAQKQINKANAAGNGFPYFIPFDNIFDKAKKAVSAISLSAQFGEGWLIAGEVASLSESGVHHVVSLQPFGCIANHIVEKGIENRLRKLYPETNILSLDFDSSVSEVNITNRLLLFINNLINM